MARFYATLDCDVLEDPDFCELADHDPGNFERWARCVQIAKRANCRGRIARGDHRLRPMHARQLHRVHNRAWDTREAWEEFLYLAVELGLLALDAEGFYLIVDWGRWHRSPSNEPAGTTAYGLPTEARTEQADLASQLRSQGMSLRAIGETMGVSKDTAKRRLEQSDHRSSSFGVSQCDECDDTEQIRTDQSKTEHHHPRACAREVGVGEMPPGLDDDEENLNFQGEKEQGTAARVVSGGSLAEEIVESWAPLYEPAKPPKSLRARIATTVAELQEWASKEEIKAGARETCKQVEWTAKNKHVSKPINYALSLLEDRTRDAAKHVHWQRDVKRRTGSYADRRYEWRPPQPGYAQ